MTDSIRLSKRLIEITGCTRREAELYIEGGWVSVNGEVVEYPQTMVTNEEVVLLPEADLISSGPATLLGHCNAELTVEAFAQTLNHSNHWTEDTSGTRLLKRHFRHLSESFPLEQGASGLCVLTQNRYMIRKWAERQVTLEQEYVVDVDGELTDDQLMQLNSKNSDRNSRKGLTKFSRQSESRLRIALKNPKSGQIREMCQSVGLNVITMRRLRIGAVSLRKMPEGQWRYMPEVERF